ncbi:hypothetical protein PLESTM_001309400 [Pleodorina starrii]|nr:hypothetical protein PLESTM_001309400 [Pleodorina starrii]
MLSRQLNVTGFNVSRWKVDGAAAAAAAEGSQNGTGAAAAAAAGGGDGGGSPEDNATTDAVSFSSGSGGGGGGGPLEVSSPYCLLAIRGGSAYGDGSLQCIGLGCVFVEGSRSYRCSGGVRCGCPPTDPAAAAAAAAATAAAGAPASLQHCTERIRTMVSYIGSAFGMSCSGADADARCKLSFDGVGFDVPLTCSPNECRTNAAAEWLRDRGGMSQPPPVASPPPPPPAAAAVKSSPPPPPNASSPPPVALSPQPPPPTPPPPVASPPPPTLPPPPSPPPPPPPPPPPSPATDDLVPLVAVSVG